jgi:hypothetical protein
MSPKVTHYDANMNRMDCASCGANVQTLSNGRCGVCIELSRPCCPLNRGRGVAIATDPRPAPRYGGLAFFCTESGDEFSVGA